MQRHKDEAFAMIGINTDSDKEEYQTLVEEHELNWRDAWMGSPGGELPRTFGVRMYPTNFLLDHEGRMRYRDLHGEALEKAVAELIEEAERAEGARQGRE